MDLQVAFASGDPRKRPCMSRSRVFFITIVRTWIIFYTMLDIQCPKILQQFRGACHKHVIPHDH